MDAAANRPASIQRRVMAVAILASFVAFLDGSVVNLALPAMARDLGGGLPFQQWVVDSYLLTLGALILLAGSISDVFGRVPVLRFGLIAFGAGSVLAAVAPSSIVLVAARAIQGLGAAFLVPSSLALINSTFDSEDQPKAIGTWTAWTGTAFVLGPLLGGLAVDLLHWRWIFVLSAVPVLITYPLTVGLSRGGEPAGRRDPIDVLGAVLAAVGLAATVFALIEVQRLGLRHPAVAGGLVIGLVSLAAFVWWQLHAPHPMVQMSLFGVRNFGIGNLATVFIYAGVSIGTLIISLFTQEVAGFSATEAGLATLPLPVLSFLLARRFGALSARFGPRAFMAAGPVLAGIGFLLMHPVEGKFNFWLQLFPGLIVFGLGLAVTVTPLTSAVLSAVDATHSGIASAINNAVSRLAGLIAVAFAGVIAGGALDYGSFLRLAAVTAAAFLLGGIVSALGIRNPAQAPEPVRPEDMACCNDRVTAPPQLPSRARA
ncbi:MFS transporter [Mycobacterium sp.]|uniref:MFS transporter n=1 Tax=Mycobacterium sp. TaxID=1785 RepID=UPI002D6CCA34|nr:MFS transporter [Mycobacterium sp.]HZA08563.1 MFS transporter [Mycobacterium sp.]